MCAHARPGGPALLYELDVRAPAGSARSEGTPPCPVCRAVEGHPVFEIEGLPNRVMRCGDCGLGRLQPMPSPEEIRSFYPDEYYGEPGAKFQPSIEGLVRWVGERHIGFLSRGLRAGARVLDVGCGRGVILGPLADRGYEAHGVELSEEATQGADPRARIRIAERLSQAGYPEQFFDQVVIWHVLEHLDDPRGTLEEIHRVLRPGGRLVVAVPNFSSLQARWTGAAWFHLDLPRHLYHFPLPALRRLLEATGFQVDSEHHFSLRQSPFGWIQSLANRWTALPRNGLYVLLHRRHAADARPFDASTRRRLWLWLLALLPLGLALTALETVLRQGATVHLVARRSAGGGGAESGSR